MTLEFNPHRNRMIGHVESHKVTTTVHFLIPWGPRLLSKDLRPQILTAISESLTRILIFFSFSFSGKHRMVTKTKPWSIDNEKSVTVLEHDPNVSQTVPLPLGNHVLTMMPNNRSCVNESWAVLGNSAPSSIEAGRALSCPAYGNARSEDPSTRHASMSTERRGKRSRSSSSRKQKKKKRKRKQRKRPRPFCMTQTIENFRTFCNQTSLHGWQYIAQKHSSSAKHLFWAMIVSLSMATASFFLYNNTMDFMDATVSEHAEIYYSWVQWVPRTFWWLHTTSVSSILVRSISLDFH